MSDFMQSLLLFSTISTIIMLASIGYTFNLTIWKWLRGLIRKKPHHMVDITDFDFFIPVPVQEAAQTLEEMGFRQDMVVEVHLPEHKTIANMLYFINPENYVGVELIEYMNKAGVQFTTWYNDDSVVETSYPFGENFDTPNYCSHFTKKSISEAYDLHREQTDKFAMNKPRVPILIRSLDACMDRELLYQIKYKPIKFRRGLMRGMGVFICTNTMVFMGLITVALWIFRELFENLQLILKIIGAILAFSWAAQIYFLAKIKHHGGA